MADQKTAWTKGPWRCSRPDMESFDARTGGQVSFVYFPDPGAERLTVATNNPVEDARLIATAPTMADYIRRRAEDGDDEAQELWLRITGETS